MSIDRLSRIPSAGVSRSRTVERLVVGHPTSDGAGVKLTRVLTQPLQRRLDPFLMLDAFRNDNPDDYIGGFPDHPHRGFETVTYMIAGRMRHRDSAGHEGLLENGGVQWMTAGRGVIHSEIPQQEEGLMEGFQLWVNLPAKDKKAEPGYQTLLKGDIPSVDLADGAGRVRVIAGDYEGQTGPARTFTPINIWDLRLGRDKTTTLALPEGHTVALAVLGGTVLVNDEAVVRAAQLVSFARTGGAITLEANNQATVLVLSGAPINEPMVAHGPFVMNTVGEIKQAMLDFEQGRFGARTETLH